MVQIAIGKYMGALRFVDDGIVPNSRYPALIYRGVCDWSEEPDADEAQEHLDDIVLRHGWYADWVGSVYKRVHYHSTAHEALVVFCGTAMLEIGGRRLGMTCAMGPGDALVLPAGLGHRRLSSSADFTVFGLYPKDQKWDLQWDWEKSRAASLRRIAKVPLPAQDPFYGRFGELQKQWK